VPVGKQPARGEALALSALGIEAPLGFLGDIRIALFFELSGSKQTTASPAARSKRTHRRRGGAGCGEQVVALLRGAAAVPWQQL